MALMLHVRSGIVDASLCVVIDIVLLYFIGRLLSMLGSLLDLRRLRSTGRTKIKEIEIPVVGSVRRTLGGCFTFASVLLVFVAVLIVETGIKGSAVERRGGPFTFDEVRYVSVDYINNAAMNMFPGFYSSKRPKYCQVLQGDWNAQYAQFHGPGVDDVEKKEICPNATDASIETLRVSGRAGRVAARYVCERKNEKFVGKITSVFGEDVGHSSHKLHPVFSSEVKIEAKESVVPSALAETKVWYSNYTVQQMKLSRSLFRVEILSAYRNRSDEENFYRVATGFAENVTSFTFEGDVNSETYLVNEQYFDFTDDQGVIEISNTRMRTSSKDVRCL